ncbi:hypothetical protein CISG_06446 [Coccidioides immitis RMSCC 3703]|uniref:Uncharacterized protein n=1 Tax=Coccidioides immitis RMSCC 3703 TaxID=454286 RepID=A0A0J8R3L8_COCIT|nr:hypothetical protein CISG_06446 [Coccidioides immitis RMSCC 3703]
MRIVCIPASSSRLTRKLVDDAFYASYPAKDVALPSELESTSRCYQVFHIEEIIPLYPSTSPTPRFGYVPLVVCTSGEGLLVGKEAKIRKSKVVVIFSAAQIHLFAQRGAMSLLCTVPGKGRQAADLDPSCPSASQDDRVNWTVWPFVPAPSIPMAHFVEKGDLASIAAEDIK